MFGVSAFWHTSYSSEDLRLKHPQSEALDRFLFGAEITSKERECAPILLQLRQGGHAYTYIEDRTVSTAASFPRRQVILVPDPSEGTWRKTRS